MWSLIPLAALAADPAAVPSPAAPAEVTALVQKVEARYQAITTLEARFVQTTRSSLYGDETQNGALWLERPNHMRWSFEGDGKLFLADGAHLWISTPVDKQVVKTPQVEGAGGADVLLTSLAHLSELFVVSLLPPATAGDTHLNLVPKTENAQFARIEVVLDPQLTPKALVLTDGTGTATDLTFTDVKLGTKLDPTLFQMTVPAGFTVVDLGAGG